MAAHTLVLFLSAVVLMFGGRLGGVAGTVAAGLILCICLLYFRSRLARLAAAIELEPYQAKSKDSDAALPVALAKNCDEGFTGGGVGLFQPRLLIFPALWRRILGPDGFDLAVRRRSLAVTIGSWRRGRLVALVFTLIGIAAAAELVGRDRLGTPGGTIAFSLWFNLWSFFGLLTLPSLSRRGVTEIDDQARFEGAPEWLIRTNTRLLDDMQDGEPTRPSLVETIFHPIPSVQSRLDGQRNSSRLGCWDAARTSVYLSAAGVGLLGRAVHCNCGRTALWVFLPTD